MSDLKQAADLVRNGDKAEARKIVGALLKREPDNDEAWYYAAMLSDTPEQRAKFLQKTLDLNPFHERADASLKKLHSTNPSSTGPKRASAPNDVKSGGSAAMYLAIGVVALLLVGMVGYGIMTLTRPQSAPATQVVPTTVLSAADFALTATAVGTRNSASADVTAIPDTLAADPAEGGATPTPAPYQITATAYLHAAQTADAALRLTATAAAGG